MQKPNAKKVIVFQVLLIGLISAACETDGVSPKTQTDANGEETSGAQLRYAEDRSNLVLPTREQKDRISLKLDSDALNERIMRLNNETKITLFEKGRHETEFYSIDANAEAGKFDVRLKEESHTRALRGKRILANEEIHAIAEGYFESLGINSDEADVSVKSILSSRRSMDGTTSGEIEEKGKFVFVNRKINDVPVVGDRMVMYYKSDGLLHGIHGKWTPVDYERSTLTTQKTRKSIVQEASEKLVEAGVAATETEFTVDTYYSPEKDEDGTNVLHLKGAVSAFTQEQRDPVKTIALTL